MGRHHLNEQYFTPINFKTLVQEEHMLMTHPVCSFCIDDLFPIVYDHMTCLHLSISRATVCEHGGTLRH